MSEATHKDPSMNWLIFFFVCFGIVVLSIGVYALFNYNANAPEDTGAGGGHGHGMILPQDGEYAPHARRPWVV